MCIRDSLKDYQPTIVVSPASTLIELANYVSNQQLAIQPVKVVSVAEILEDRDAETIAKAFQLDKVDQVYQATEGFLACTCSEGNLHLNEDILSVEKEYLDDSRSIATASMIFWWKKSPLALVVPSLLESQRSKDDRTISSISIKKMAVAR